jgi:hypothetical protein
MAGATFHRQVPTVGAGCLNWARPDLCGGRLERDVPTAIGVPQGHGSPHGQHKNNAKKTQ